MYINHYDIELLGDNNDTITAELRLTIAAQRDLRKSYKKDTRSLLFAASTDDDMLMSILDKALSWPGNNNSVKNGEELFERMIDGGNMGVVARQRLAIEIGAASGIFSISERDKLVKKIDAAEKTMFDGSDGVSIDVEESGEKKA